MLPISLCRIFSLGSGQLDNIKYSFHLDWISCLLEVNYCVVIFHYYFSLLFNLSSLGFDNFMGLSYTHMPEFVFPDLETGKWTELYFT